MWDPLLLATLLTSMACYRDSFIYFYLRLQRSRNFNEQLHGNLSYMDIFLLCCRWDLNVLPRWPREMKTEFEVILKILFKKMQHGSTSWNAWLNVARYRSRWTPLNLMNMFWNEANELCGCEVNTNDVIYSSERARRFGATYRLLLQDRRWNSAADGGILRLFLLVLIFSPLNGGNVFLRNVGISS
jgi:hypothetical protein